jgi:hypothetical protein
MKDSIAASSPSTWDPTLDAAAAPKHHIVIFENARQRFLE